jgi:hypothetical protein
VYLGRYLPGLGSAYSLRSVGPLTEVSPTEASPQPFTSPAAVAHPLSATLANTIQLLGYNLDAPAVTASAAWPLTLFWRTDVPADGNYLVSLRLVDATGQTAWQSPERVPVDGLYPTNAWRPGETVSDFYLMPSLPALAPGDYRLEAGLFPPFHVSDSGWTLVTGVAVGPAAQSPRPSRLLRAQLGQQWLMGYDLPETAAPGSTFKATLYWLRDSKSDVVTALGETRSLAAWPLDRLAPQTYRLTAPSAGSQMMLTLAGSPPSAGAEAICGWLSAPTPGCSLPPVRLVGEAAAEGAVNFDNQVLLRQAVLQTTSAKPGDFVDVTLHWQALQPIAEDYTVFVHLVGPDGKLYGQVDYFPVGGTERTSRWKPGQIVADPYHVQLSYEAPPGDYTVYAGFYLLATWERLPVLNAEGTPIDDHAYITGLTVR